MLATLKGKIGREKSTRAPRNTQKSSPDPKYRAKLYCWTEEDRLMLKKLDRTLIKS
jgi:hypothetical protein